MIKYFSIEVAECTGCGHKVRGTYPELAKDQFGAMAHWMGPRIYAGALAWHYDSGMSWRQVEKVINDYFQIPVIQSALTQKALKAVEHGGIGELAQKIFDVESDDFAGVMGAEKLLARVAVETRTARSESWLNFNLFRIADDIEGSFPMSYGMERFLELPSGAT